jgi:hypothetical protein
METLVLTIAGSLILILLSIIGYLIVEGRVTQKEINNELFELIRRLNDTINNLDRTLFVMAEKHSGFEKRYEEHRKTCAERFENLKNEGS